ncbi:cobalt-precorrin-5B (C(1))-methyltransferase [Prosthecodimorpha staleyi]|uniref:Cobalt-precorrin-5B C(1)-methyltransferase n=1 Tax=Prosthecodimorpha staleyi TaxID=2840188 RepID=A0A947D820_9HYPH|nr:cobalt-precorrin-5B (C(1))-methyltransferase [Prosthecodimorpha staleyi]MBT9291804.1 cobalt-precorrin-5B (C(1))-methyltransferase [Prosthecodimorpha staleyi]
MDESANPDPNDADATPDPTLETGEPPAGTALRRGWTTGACATAAAKAACEALLTGAFPDPVSIRLPGGETPAFTLALQEHGAGWARAGIVKDAGDDPDVTHGALVTATLRFGPVGSGVTFRAGEGVGTVTRPGLPIPPGEPAINPVPRRMMREAIAEVAGRLGRSGDVLSGDVVSGDVVSGDVEIEIAIPGGARLAERTLNGRLGIVGGLSILGTTGIVVPYSCAAWIHSIHRGIDVARAMGFDHVAGSTGSTSEDAVRVLHGLDEVQLIDMGDFVGGMLKYIRAHPVARVTVCGGFAKMAKLGQGLLDLHSKRGAVDLDWLAGRLAEAGAAADLVAAARGANSALEVMEMARAASLDLGRLVAEAAWATAARPLVGTGIALEIVVFDRQGGLVAETGFRTVD